MMHETIAGFDWDEANLAECQQHGVSVREIEGLFARPHTIRADVAHSLREQRLKAIGQARSGRFVFLVFTFRERDGSTYLRPISARYMNRKEVQYYEKEDPGLSH